MAEKAMWQHSLVVALTYNDDTERSRDAAQFFDYDTVSAFLKRLRRQMVYHHGDGALSFIACGELGDRFKRVHWHMVLFSNVDLTQVGVWTDRHGPTKDRANIISPKGGVAWRRSWSVWGHGFATVQEPDYGGMRYAMAYALKDQFNVRNAVGTAREASAEVFGTGYFVPSKRPAIGARFVDAYVEECAARGVVPPSRKLKIPGVDVPWWPTGVLADRLLCGLADVNAGIRKQTGRDSAGWAALLHEARDNDNDLERLGVIGDDIEEEDEGSQSVWQTIGGAAAERIDARHRSFERRRCGSTEPCSACIRGRDALETDGFLVDDKGRFHRAGQGPSDFAKSQRDGARKGPNPLCAVYGTDGGRGPKLSHIFPVSASERFGKAARTGN